MGDYGNMTLLEGIEIFFDAIKEKCSTDEQYAAELLKARGFLLEDNELALSDNSHKWDAEYLNKLLTSENVGEVQGNKIIIFPGGNVERIFYSSIQNGCEAFCNDAVDFFHYNFAPKVPVCLLEKFIARYVKAISACRIETHGSCDGNHHRPPFSDSSSVYIEITDAMSFMWHELICKKLLSKKYNLHWINFRDTFQTAMIKFKKVDKWKTYIELNRAAEFLYKNRIKIRQIRRDVLDEIIAGKSRRAVERMTYEELKKPFFRKADKLFDELF